MVLGRVVKLINIMKTKKVKRKIPQLTEVEITPVSPVDPDEHRQLKKIAANDFAKISKAVLNEHKAKRSKHFLLKIAGDALEWISSEGLDNIFVNEYITKKYKLNMHAVGRYMAVYPEFNAVLRQAYELQEYKLARLMLRNKVNTQAAIFTLKNRHGWADKTQVEVSQNVVDAVQEARLRVKRLYDDDETKALPDDTCDAIPISTDNSYSQQSQPDHITDAIVYTPETNADS